MVSANGFYIIIIINSYIINSYIIIINKFLVENIPKFHFQSSLVHYELFICSLTFESIRDRDYHQVMIL